MGRSVNLYQRVNERRVHLCCGQLSIGPGEVGVDIRPHWPQRKPR
jgi:hypothetical protein